MRGYRCPAVGGGENDFLCQESRVVMTAQPEYLTGVGLPHVHHNELDRRQRQRCQNGV